MKRWPVLLGAIIAAGTLAYFFGPVLLQHGWRIDYDEQQDKQTGKAPKLPADEAALLALRDDFQASKSPRPSAETLKKIRELAALGTQAEGLADVINDWQARMFDAGQAEAAEFRELARIQLAILPDAAVRVVAMHYDAWNPRDREFAGARLVAFGKGALPALLAGLTGESWHEELSKFPSHSRLPVALARLCDDALPALREALKQSDKPHVRRQAVRAIALMARDKAAAAIPDLNAALGDSDGRVRFLAVLALGELVPADTPLPDRVAALLDDKESAVRLAAARSLGKHPGAPTERLAAVLTGLLRDNNFDSWYWAVALEDEPPGRALLCQGVPWSQVFYEELTAYLMIELDLAHSLTPAAVLDLLKHCKHQGRHLGLLLATEGDRAKDAVPGLVEMLRAEEPALRYRATCVLSELGDHVTDPAILQIARALQHPDFRTRWHALECLAVLKFSDVAEFAPYVKGRAAFVAGMTRRPADVVELRTVCVWEQTEATLQPAVRKGTKPDHVPWMRSDIASDLELAFRHALLHACAAAKKRDRAAVPVLVGMWLDTPAPPWNGDRQSPLDVLAAYGPDAAEAAPHLVAGLRPSNAKAVAKTLVAIGDAALPALVRALEDPKEAARHGEILAVLQAFGPRATPAVHAVAKALAAADEEMRKAAADTFGTLGPAAKEAVPEVRKLLSDARPDVRRRAAQALGHIGADAAPALPGMIALFRDDDADVRTAAVRSTAKIGKPAVAPLTAALDDADARSRLGAVEALEAVGPDARPAVAALDRLAQQDPDPAVRAAARQAAQKLRMK